jgi:hypothetical protein
MLTFTKKMASFLSKPNEKPAEGGDKLSRFCLLFYLEDGNDMFL